MAAYLWGKGRQLASLQAADNSVSYKYNSNGMRTPKTDNSGTTYYYYDSNNNLGSFVATVLDIASEKSLTEK